MSRPAGRMPKGGRPTKNNVAGPSRGTRESRESRASKGTKGSVPQGHGTSKQAKAALAAKMAKAVEAKQAQDRVSAPRGSEDVPQSRAQKWLWRVAVGATVVVLVGLVTAAVVVLGNNATKTGAGSQPNPSSSVSSSASAEPSESPSSGESFVIEPGAFGKPSLPGTDPADAWDGAQPIDSANVDSFKAALTDKWSMEFSTRPLLGGIMETGLSGDTARKQRRLDAIIEYNDSNVVFQVMCQAGGSEVTPTDDSSVSFMSDCLATTAQGEDWTILKAWIDSDLRNLVEGESSAWIELSSMRMYAESNQHLVSCTLTNS